MLAISAVILVRGISKSFSKASAKLEKSRSKMVMDSSILMITVMPMMQFMILMEKIYTVQEFEYNSPGNVVIGMIGMAVIAAGVAVMVAEEAEDTTTVEVVAVMIDMGVLVIAAGAAAAVAVTHRVAKQNFVVLWKISAPPLLGRI